MRLLRRNLRTMWYALYDHMTDQIDSNGDKTGDPLVVYSAPVEFEAVLSPGRGYSGGAGTTSQNIYGIDVDAERRIVTDDLEIPISETSLIYLHEPKTLQDGSADPADADYSVSARPAAGLNFLAFPIKSRLRNEVERVVVDQTAPTEEVVTDNEG